MPESRLKDKAKDVVQEHPYATGAAATGTAVLGAKYGRLARAGYSLRKLKQGDRAARLARDMAPSRSGNVGMDPLAQQKAHLALKRKNSDLRYVKPTAERWSKTFKNASRIKSADPDKKVRVAEAVFRPGKTTARVDRRIIDTMVNASEPRSQPLYRSHRQGASYDGSPTSFTSDKHLAEIFNQHKRGQARLMGKGNSALSRTLRHHQRLQSSDQPHHVVAVSGEKALNISAASPRFAQNEWVVAPKGKAKPVAKSMSAFGVIHDDAVAKAIGLPKFSLKALKSPMGQGVQRQVSSTLPKVKSQVSTTANQMKTAYRSGGGLKGMKSSFSSGMRTASAEGRKGMSYHGTGFNRSAKFAGAYAKPAAGVAAVGGGGYLAGKRDRY